MINHTEKKYSLLGWDSGFFGFPVAMIHQGDIAASRLKNLLLTLKKKGVRLVYWSAAPENELSRNEIKKFKGLLVDQKTTFVLKSDLPDAISHVNDEVEPYNSEMPFVNLESLAMQCGQFSRFAIDPNIPRNKYIELYKIWIEKSVSGELADTVLIVKNAMDIQGLITLKNNSGSESGEIGLLVVDKKYRNQHIGTQLVRAGLQWFQKSKVRLVRVVTQDANTSACRFYEQCGFLREKSINFYHFWL